MNAIILMFVLTTFQPDAEQCSLAKLDQAETAMDSMTTWQAVDDFYARYQKCDDGYIQEGASDRIIRLLVDKWHELDELAARVKSHPALAEYVLMHISSYLDREDLLRLQMLASAQCKRENRALCNCILSRVSTALKRLSAFEQSPPALENQKKLRNYFPVIIDAA